MSAQAKEKWSLNARCNQKRAPSALPVSRVPEVVLLSEVIQTDKEKYHMVSLT